MALTIPTPHPQPPHQLADVIDIRTGGTMLMPARVTYTVPEIAALLRHL